MSSQAKKPSTAIAALLSLLVPGSGLYYLGRSVGEAAAWFATATSAEVALSLVAQGHVLRDSLWAGELIIGIHLLALAHTLLVSRASSNPLDDIRRLPALSVVLPGLGQLKGSNKLRGVGWLLGEALLILLPRFLAPPTSKEHVAGSALFVAGRAYSLLSGYDAYRIARSRRPETTPTNGEEPTPTSAKPGV